MDGFYWECTVGEFLDYLRNYQLLMIDSVEWCLKASEYIF
jgi:hypothetical protein